jgi:hypothetical protein
MSTHNECLNAGRKPEDMQPRLLAKGLLILTFCIQTVLALAVVYLTAL